MRPHLVKSIVLHAVLLAALTLSLLSEQATVDRQEEQFIAEVQAAEQALDEAAEAEAEAAAQAAEDRLRDQIRDEMDLLVATELAPPEYEHLSELTAGDIDQRVDELADGTEFDTLTPDEYMEVADAVREGAFGQVRVNVGQMQRDLLLAQVRRYIRTVVAPDIKRQIEARLKSHTGSRINAAAVRQATAERRNRIGALASQLRAAAAELTGIKRTLGGVAREVSRPRLARAADQLKRARQRQGANRQRVDAILKSVQRLVPASANRAGELRSELSAGKVAPALIEAARVVAQAKAGDADSRAAAGQAVAKALAVTGERINQLTGLVNQLNAASRARTPDRVNQQIVREAIEPLTEALKQRVVQEVRDTAIPIAADRLMTALDAELTKRNLKTPEFEASLRERIAKALDEETRANSPDPDVALTQTRETFSLRDQTRLAEAAEDVRAVAAKLAKLAAEQEKIRSDVPTERPSDDLTRQQRQAWQARGASNDAIEVLRRVGPATTRQGRNITQTLRRIERRTADRQADNAAGAMQREVVADAKMYMEASAKELSRSAGEMSAIAKGLDIEAESVAKRAAKSMDLVAALGEDQAAKVVADAAAEGKKVIDQRVRPAVQQAARAVEVKGVFEDAEALQRLAALDDKLAQIAANMAEGRGLDALADFGMLGPGQGRRPIGPSGGDGKDWGLPIRSKLSRFNREAYEKFVKHMRYRLNPDNYYEDAEDIEGLDSLADPVAGDRVATVVVETFDEPEPAEAERAVPEPAFAHVAFAAAAMMTEPVTIDGDLSDWGELRHGLTMRFGAESLDPIYDGPTVYIRWSADGFYLGYTVKDPGGIQPCPDYSWRGDGMEFMIDMANSRLDRMEKNFYAHKFSFTPFGCRGRKDLTVWEMGRNLYGQKMAHGYPDSKGVKGVSAARLTDDGYTVECFLSRRALARPQLMAGKYVAANMSINVDEQANTSRLWSVSSQLQTWRRPDTWGDVLLLGADAKLRFVASADLAAGDIEGVCPGEPIFVEIADADMNLNALKVDRVGANLRVAGADLSVYVVAAETGVNTGVFRGSINTQPYFKPARANTLNVRGGDVLELEYLDARAEFGEKNRPVTAKLPVGWPVVKLSGK